MPSDEGFTGEIRPARRDGDHDGPHYRHLSDLGEPLDLLGRPDEARAPRSRRGPGTGGPDRLASVAGRWLTGAARRVMPAPSPGRIVLLVLLAGIVIRCAESWSHVIRPLP